MVFLKNLFKKITPLFLTIILIMGIISIKEGLKRENDRKKVKEEKLILTKKSDEIIKEVKKEIKNKKIDLSEISKKIISPYKEKYPSILGVLDVGEGLVREPFIYSEDLYYLWRDPNGDDSLGGSVFIYGGTQTNPRDNYSVYYGHGMRNRTKFGPFLDYDINLDKMKTMTIYDTQGVRTFELVHLSEIEIYDFNETNLTSYDEINNYINTVRQKGDIIYEKGQIESSDFLASLSTCSTASGSLRLVLIYREI